MKLVIVVVNNNDSDRVTSALTHKGYIVTTLSTTGGFLRAGNTTLLIGAEDSSIDEIREILKKHSSTRKQINPTSSSFGHGLGIGSIEENVTVGGATMFILNVEGYEKL